MELAPATDGGSKSLPKELVDAHHHFFDTINNDFSKVFLGSLLQDSYLPDQYQKDVVEPLDKVGVKVVGSVHVEAMPDDGFQEAEWVAGLESTVSSIVAGCDLASPDVVTQLAELKKCPKVQGIRWILDCVGKFDPDTATHVGNLRHDGIDYLRGSNGGYDGDVVPEFERGFALLAQHGFSFDLQCAPAQLQAAAKLCSRHPDIPVCIEHLGKPRKLLGPGDLNKSSPSLNQKELETWREGMKAMAALPHVHVKISMLGYAVPGWMRSPERMQFLKEIIEETVDLFGSDRSMVALNWWKDGATSDADGFSDIGPDAVEFVNYMEEFFLAKYSADDHQKIFAENAKRFYNIN